MARDTKPDVSERLRNIGMSNADIEYYWNKNKTADNRMPADIEKQSINEWAKPQIESIYTNRIGIKPSVGEVANYIDRLQASAKSKNPKTFNDIADELVYRTIGTDRSGSNGYDLKTLDSGEKVIISRNLGILSSEYERGHNMQPSYDWLVSKEQEMSAIPAGDTKARSALREQQRQEALGNTPLTISYRSTSSFPYPGMKGSTTESDSTTLPSSGSGTTSGGTSSTSTSTGKALTFGNILYKIQQEGSGSASGYADASGLTEEQSNYLKGIAENKWGVNDVAKVSGVTPVPTSEDVTLKSQQTMLDIVQSEIDRWNKLYGPIEEQLTQKAMRPESAEPMLAGVSQEFARAKDAGKRGLLANAQEYGLTPESPQYTTTVANMQSALAAAEAGARNQARQQAKAKQEALQLSLLGAGMAIPGQATSGASAAGSSGLGSLQADINLRGQDLTASANQQALAQNESQFTRQLALEREASRLASKTAKGALYGRVATGIAGAALTAMGGGAVGVPLMAGAAKG